MSEWLHNPEATLCSIPVGPLSLMLTIDMTFEKNNALLLLYSQVWIVQIHGVSLIILRHIEVGMSSFQRKRNALNDKSYLNIRFFIFRERSLRRVG